MHTKYLNICIALDCYMRKFLILISFIILIPGIASAGTTLSPDSGHSNQNQINEALEEGDVYLEAGVYEIDGPIYIGSNTILTGDSDAIIRVWSGSSQWFVRGTGIINHKDYPLKNVEIYGFQIDGNLDELPRSYANEGKGDHNAERLIYLRGNKKAFMENIAVHDMQLYDSYSDGVQIAFCNNAQVYNNFVSNCQHSGMFLISVVGGDVAANDVAGITSDCVRLDNCVNCIIHDNVLYSYTGDNLNGQGTNGENGLQIADEGYSHGGGSAKPTHTTNIEVYGNTFANTGLRAIWVDSTGKGVDNVYIHDNKFLEGSEIERAGTSVDGVSIEDISYEKPPSKEMSEQVFDSIFSLLDMTFYNVAGGNYSVVLPNNSTEIPSESTWTLEQHENATLLYGPDAGLTSVHVEHEGKKGVHTLLLGERMGFKMVYSNVSIWNGEIPRSGDSFYLDGKVEPEDIQIECYTPRGSFEPAIEVTEVESNRGIFSYYIIVYLLIVGIFLSVPVFTVYIVFKR